MTSRITSVAELRELYREPSRLVQAKVKGTLDAASRSFIERAPFALVATMSADQHLDVSPRGGPPGFLLVRDDGSIAIPDLNGNNLIDTLRGVVETGRVGLLVLHPGKEETLRVNGRAYVTIDDAVLDGFTAELRRPKSAIVIEPDEVFIHCAKAFRRGRVWDTDTWPSYLDAPDAIDILSCQMNLDATTTANLRSSLAEGYETELAAD